MRSRPTLPSHSLLFLALVFLPFTAWAGPQEITWDRINERIKAQLAEGDTPGALASAREAADLARASFGNHHMKTAVSLRKLADIERLSGQPRQAAASLAEAGTAWSTALGGRHPYVADIGTRSALDLEAADDPAAAIKALTQAVTDQKEYFGARHTAVARTLQALARAERKSGDGASADRHEREAADILLEALPAAHPRVLEAYRSLALRLAESGDLAGARAQIRTVLAAASVGPVPVAGLADLHILGADLAFQDRDLVAAEAGYGAAQNLYDDAGGLAADQSRLDLLYKQREFFYAAGREEKALEADVKARAIEASVAPEEKVKER